MSTVITSGLAPAPSPDPARPPKEGERTAATRHNAGQNGFVRVCSLNELQEKGTVVPGGTGQSLALFWHEEQIYAVDNRCPHMGFPLSKGFCNDGILTCYWHYARFDLKSGGTFDPWADDVPAFPVEVRDGDVWVDLRPSRTPEEERAHWTKRLYATLEQNISLVQAKAILALRDLAANPIDEAPANGAGVSAEDTATRHIVATAAEYGLRFGSRRNSGGWGDGLTILTGMATLQPDLAPAERALALYHGCRRVGEDAAGQMQRVELEPLPVEDMPPAQLKRWFREFVEVRDAQAAERALRTAIATGWTPEQLTDLLAAAATDHYYRDFSHVMDTLAHAADVLDVIGWDQAARVLPALAAQWASATREEEKNSWRHPEDLAGMVAARIPHLASAVDLSATTTGAWDGALVQAMLGTDPEANLDAILAALRRGLPVADAAEALAYASAVRLARFPTSNEFGDWDTALHAFTYCASLAQVARRAPSVELARAILDGAMVVYQTRFLNVPAAGLPHARALAALPDGAASLLTRFSNECEGPGGVDQAGATVYRYLTLGHDPAQLIRTLGTVVLREDCGFHDFQMLEEGVRLAKSLLSQDTDAKREAAFQVLVAIARWQAAHAPTRRAITQTYDIARRLHRGEAVYEDAM